MAFGKQRGSWGVVVAGRQICFLYLGRLLWQWFLSGFRVLILYYRLFFGRCRDIAKLIRRLLDAEIVKLVEVVEIFRLGHQQPELVKAREKDNL